VFAGWRRSPHDREILLLAFPALGSLAAEPLYVLADTAIVGHLGREQLAALGIAAVVLGGVFAIFNFLTYGTTAQVARAHGAGFEEAAHRLGAQALWLSLAVGCAVAVAVAAFAEPVARAMGVEGTTAEYATTYMRIAAVGLPFAFLTFGAQGWMRGVADLRTPLVILVAANVLNIALELLFVYGLDWGIEGSAWGTAIAQIAMGIAFLVRSLRGIGAAIGVRLRLMGRLVQVGRHIFVRTVALYASFLLAGAVIGRFGDASLAAHQIAFQLWIFLALVLDAVAIAGQVIVGRALGRGDTAGAYAASARMIAMSVYLGGAFALAMLLLGDVLPRLFTGDAAVLDRTAALWPLFALMQPLNGAVFALDGILIGAGDGRYLMWSMVASFCASAVAAVAALHYEWGVAGVWAALLVLICVRLVTLGTRFRRRRWLRTGWAG
jgi:putative MATE family efflux protein